MLKRELLEIKIAEYLDSLQVSEDCEVSVDDIKDNDKDFEVIIAVESDKVDEIDKYALEEFVEKTKGLEGINVEFSVNDRNLIQELGEDFSGESTEDDSEETDLGASDIELDDEHGLAKGDYTKIIHTAEDDEEEDEEFDDRGEDTRSRSEREEDEEDYEDDEYDMEAPDYDDDYQPEQASFGDLEEFNRDWGIDDDDGSRY